MVAALAGPDLAPIEPKNKRERELRDRAVRDYGMLQSVGLDTTRTFFAPGTEVGQGWADKFAASKIRAARLAFEELDPDGLDRLIEHIIAEDRQDVQVKLGGDSAADPDSETLQPSLYGGWMAGKWGKAARLEFGPTERACQQFMSYRPAGDPAPGGDFLSWLQRAERKDVVIRHRKLPANRQSAYMLDAREAYAIVSPGYKAYDLDAATRDLQKAAPAGSRARVRYDGQRATVDVVLQNPYVMSDGSTGAAVGETHRVVLRMRTADDGTGGYHLSILAERVRCVNLTLLHAKRSLFHGTHRQDDLSSLAQEAIASIEPTMQAFAQTWAGAWQDYWTDKYTKQALDGAEAVRRIVLNGKYRIPGLGAEGTLDACLAALNEEPGDSRAHVHNALTRAAHSSPTSWATRWADEEAEEQASKLLYQSVRWLPEVEDAQA